MQQVKQSQLLREEIFCGMGGILAGRAVVNAIENNRDTLLCEYQKDWSSIFGAEFKKMKIVREILERLDNKALISYFLVSLKTRLVEYLLKVTLISIRRLYIKYWAQSTHQR